MGREGAQAHPEVWVWERSGGVQSKQHAGGEEAQLKRVLRAAALACTSKSTVLRAAPGLAPSE